MRKLRKYKYYFKKPRSEIVKDVLTALLTIGAIYVAASSPYFVMNLIRQLRKWQKYPKKRIYDVFYNLKRQGLILMEKKGKQIYISLTPEGKKKAGIYQINDLKIKKPKKWDKVWRILIFDISELKKTHREALRGLLKSLGFYQLQKSVWIYPFDCEAEISLLRDFFGLTEKEMRLIIAKDIGDDLHLRKFFKLA